MEYAGTGWRLEHVLQYPTCVKQEACNLKLAVVSTQGCSLDRWEGLSGVFTAGKDIVVHKQVERDGRMVEIGNQPEASLQAAD